MSKKSFLRLILPILTIAIIFCPILSNRTSVSAKSCGGVATAIIECGDEESGIGHTRNLLKCHLDRFGKFNDACNEPNDFGQQQPVER